ncbi:MAG: CoA pyrophosphatase [Deltaproteobacteria bacterium]|nr:CoA pyrophosphatase [Deltaproteobacteria bacterium]
MPAAVLLLLFERDGECHVLFTKRSDKVAHHKGEISFPGGTVDPDDRDFLHTALREGAEEIGLDSPDVTILGRLDDIFTVTTGFIVTPYVGIIPHPYPFQINADEISELIFLPLRALGEESQVETSRVTWEGEKVTLYDFHVQGHVIWGATARILKQFLDLINRG